MAKKLSRAARRQKVHLRIRGKVLGTADRPRLCVYRSLKHTYAQLIDDSQGKTLASVSSLKLDGKKLPNGGNVSTAKDVGREIANAAKKLGIDKVIFDRSGYVYHGRIKALAESVREAGLKF